MGKVFESESLISTFKELHKSPPEWAWRFNPSIPLIGHQYKCGSGVLVYASAEYLEWLPRNELGEKDESKAPEWFHGDRSWNRYREQFESEERKSEGLEPSSIPFFPNVGIQPVNDGGLLAAGLYASLCLGRETRDDPREFLEVISLSNLCKFTIRNVPHNKDYIHNAQKVRCSLPFLKAELEHLRPHVVLIPHRAGVEDKDKECPGIKEVLQAASPETHFLDVPQFNRGNVNRMSRLKKLDEPEAERLRQQWEGKTLGTWMEELKGGCRKNGWRYLAWVEKEISKIPPAST